MTHLDDAADLDDAPVLGDQLLRGLELVDDLLRRIPGSFMVRPPAQYGRMSTLIKPGPTSGVHVTFSWQSPHV